MKRTVKLFLTMLILNFPVISSFASTSTSTLIYSFPYRIIEAEKSFNMFNCSDKLISTTKFSPQHNFDLFYKDRGVTVKFEMESLRCEETTEFGVDEVFIKMVYMTELGYKTSYNYPNDNYDFHWNLDDGDLVYGAGSRSVDNYHLLDVNSGDKVSASIYVMIFEKDGGDVANDVGSFLLKNCSYPGCQAGYQVLQILKELDIKIVENTDDFIGAFTVQIGGEYPNAFAYSVKNLQRVSSSDGYKQNGFLVNFNGDGSEYTGKFFFH